MPTTGSTTERWRRPLAIAALALVPAIAAVAVGIWRWVDSSATRAAAMPQPADTLAVALDRALQRSSLRLPPGIAIRPLDVPQGNSDLRPIADSVCESLTGGLTRLRALRVASCSSTRTAVAAELDDAQLARLLRVNYVLSGRIEQDGEDRLRVQLILRDLPARQARWQIDEAMAIGALQALPARVSEATAQAIGETAPPSTEVPLDPELYPLMLRASQLARRPSPDERREALLLVERVLAAAPEHVPAQYMRLGLISQLGSLPGVPASQASAAQIRAAQDAVRLEIRELGQRLVAADPGDWRGNILLINDALMHRRWAEALDRADTVVQHAHNHPGMLRIAARVNLHMGYISRAQALALDAARIDALDAEAFGVLVITHGIHGDATAMRELLAIAEQLGHRQLELPKIIDALRRGDRTSFERSASTWALSGRSNEPLPAWASAWLAAVVDPMRRGDALAAFDAVPDGVRALRAEFLVEYALMAEHRRAMQALQQLVRRPVGPWAQHLWWPELESLRRDPAFIGAMGNLGLIALWDARGAPDLCQRSADGAWSCR